MARISAVTAAPKTLAMAIFLIGFLFSSLTAVMPSGWGNTDDDVLTPEAAITAFGFTAISKGLIKALGEASPMVILKEKLEGRLAALTKALEAKRFNYLQCTVMIMLGILAPA